MDRQSSTPLTDGNQKAIDHGEPRRGSKEAALACLGRWAGDPQELDRLGSEVQIMRELERS